MEKRGEEEQVRTIATKRTENEKGIELMAVLILHNANENRGRWGDG